MWFKNIQVYKLGNLKTFSEEELEKVLTNEMFVPCGEHDITKTGFEFFFEDDPEEKRTRKVGNCYFFRLRTEDKLIPSSVVKDRLKARVQKYMEENDNKKPSKNEKESFKEAIIIGLAKNAFVASKYLEGYIDYDNKLLIVNAGSPKKSEEFISYLRAAFGGSLEAVPFATSDDISSTITGWLSNHSVPKEFDVGINCELKDLDGGVISVKKHDVDTEEVTQHIENGKTAVKLELVWQKRVRFSLTSKFEIKSIKMEDIIKEDIKDELGDSKDIYNEFQANMLMMTGDFAEIISDLERSVD